MAIESAVTDIVSKLHNRKALSPLNPTHAWHPGLDAIIADIPEEELAKDRPDGRNSAIAWKAALHLWNDSLDAAHNLVQDLRTPTGSALHGIVHRREGDYSNAKYWVRQTGDHPVYQVLHLRAESYLNERLRSGAITASPVGVAIKTMIGQGAWNPYLFTEAVAIHETRIGDDFDRVILETLQQLELESFFRFLEGRISLE
jgi:hypothetical protein